MASGLVQIMLLAAVSDGEIDQYEKKLLETYRELYPPLRKISQEEINQEQVQLFNRIRAGMKINHIVEAIGDNLSEDEKNTGYALAVEVCASNFKMVPPETDLLEVIKKSWKIKKEIIKNVDSSVRIRYSEK